MLTVQATGMIGNSFSASEGRLFSHGIGRARISLVVGMSPWQSFCESIIEKCTTGEMAVAR